jgi:hypothetical protein
MSWAFAGYPFPTMCQPERARGAGWWNRTRKVVIQEPINATITVLTDYGFTSGRREITGVCNPAFRNQMQSFFTNRTIGNLVDEEGASQSAQILEGEFKEMIPSQLYSYRLLFIAR